MKTSNIIILAFSILIVSSMLILFIDAKNYAVEYSNEKNDFKLREVALSSFSVVVAEEGSDVHIDQADSNKIGIEYPNGEKVPNKLYALSNDTLYVYGKFRTWVKCKTISRIISHRHNWLGVNYLKTDSLVLDLNGGQAFIRNKESRIQIKHLQINSNHDSYVEVNDLITNSIHINCKNKSNVRIFGNYNQVHSTLANHSELTMNNNPLEMNIIRDSTSHYRNY